MAILWDFIIGSATEIKVNFLRELDNYQHIFMLLKYDCKLGETIFEIDIFSWLSKSTQSNTLKLK